MSIPSTSNAITPDARLLRRAASPRVFGALLLSLCVLPGCGYTGGQLLYFLGVGKGQLIPAEFKLTSEPVLILVDDPGERIDWPPARAHIQDELAAELIAQKAAVKIIPRATLEGLRQTRSDFDKRGAREIGELAGADQVIWLEIRSFLADEQISDATTAAYVGTSVKVLNAREDESRSRVRLWPTSPEGRPVSVSLPGDAVARLKTRDAISRELAKKLAVDITRLFHEHRLDDFGK